MAWLPLTRSVASFVLRAGDRVLACAPLVFIPHTQLVEDNSEADLFSMAMRMHEQRGSQFAGDEGTFMRMKEDAMRWLPGMDAVIEKVKNIKIVLSAVCKNCAGAFNAMRDSMEATGRRFKDYRIIIYENNSGDNTAALHRSWAAANPKVSIRSFRVSLAQPSTPPHPSPSPSPSPGPRPPSLSHDYD